MTGSRQAGDRHLYGGAGSFTSAYTPQIGHRLRGSRLGSNEEVGVRAKRSPLEMVLAPVVAMRPHRLMYGLLGLSLATASMVVGATSADAAAVQPPGQFVAKLYTEALGRAPDAGGWSFYLNSFAAGGCTRDTVQQTARAFYTSPEFSALPYRNAPRMLALYRGALNREPDQGGLDYYQSLLDGGTQTWTQVVDTVLGGPEFASLAATICNGSTSYYYGTAPAPVLPTSGEGFTGGTGEQLQALLDSQPAGGTVRLAQSAVVRLTGTLVVPAGKTLETVGTPEAAHYALQGRLVRSASFDGPVVQVSGGARLRHVWVDGQRGIYTNYSLRAINVQTMGGSGTEVSGSKISNSRGWTSLVSQGTADGMPCPGTTIAGNLVTAYSSEHHMHDNTGRWTDGISVACERATVRNNAVIDATDVGIVLFGAPPATQASVIQDNLVLSAGNAAYGAIVLDPLTTRGTNDFTGTRVSRNTFWTASNTHFDIGISVGTRPWFGKRADPGIGAVVTANTTGTLTAVVDTGIAISGMYNVVVQHNNLNLDIRNVSRCPDVRIGVDDADGSVGDIQPGGTSVRFTDSTSGDGCIGH
jgi:hypothetical protein